MSVCCFAELNQSIAGLINMACQHNTGTKRTHFPMRNPLCVLILLVHVAVSHPLWRRGCVGLSSTLPVVPLEWYRVPSTMPPQITSMQELEQYKPLLMFVKGGNDDDDDDDRR